jgi:ABC-type amino acid transport substrate-binding protein
MAIFRMAVLALCILLMLSATCSGSEPPRLIVGTKEAPPFAMKTQEGDWIGISIDLWRRIADELGIVPEFREMDLKGLLQGVETRKLDAAVAALTITAEREENLDFTHPFYTTGLGIAVKFHQGSPWLTVVKRFVSLAFLKVVSALALLLLVVGLLVWWFERKQNHRQFGGSAARGIGSGFWWSAVTMTTVGYGDKAPLTVGGRIVALIWMFAGIIIISSFTAALTTALTVSELGSIVKGPEDLPKVRVGTVLDSTSESYLLEKRISVRLYKTSIEGLQALAENRIDAVVYDAPLLHHLIKQRFQGTLDVLPDKIMRQDYGIALQAQSPWRERINRILLEKISEPEWEDTLQRYLGT